MKKLLLLTVVAALPLGLMAQDDDMYFVPTKENVAKETKNYGMPKKTYYSGSNRSVEVGLHHGILIVIIILSMTHGSILGTIICIMVTTIAGTLLGVMVGMAVIIVLGDTIVGTHLTIIMAVVVDIQNIILSHQV